MEKDINHSTNHQEELSFADFIHLIKNAYKEIIITGFIFSLLAGFYIFNTPNVFTSYATVKVNDDGDMGGGIESMLNQYSSIASFAGVNIPSESSSKAQYVMATLESRAFFRELYSDEVFAKTLFASSIKIEGDNIIYYFDDVSKIEDHTWSDKPSFEDAFKRYRELIIPSRNPETGFISISATHFTPDQAKKLLENIIYMTNKLIRSKHLDESSMALSYLKKELANSPEDYLQQSLSALIEGQLKVQMIANIRDDYIITEIDPPFLPEYKSGPRRLNFIITFFVLGIILQLMFRVYKFYFRDLNQTKNK